MLYSTFVSLIMITIYITAALLLQRLPLVTAIRDAHCGFPEGSTPLDPQGGCLSVDNPDECDASYFPSVTQCFWDNGICTSDAFGMDNQCPFLTDSAVCDDTRFLRFRHCTWYEAITAQPSTTPSVSPSTFPSDMPSVKPSVTPTTSPSSTPSAAPTTVNYCGLPFVGDPWTGFRQVCSDAASERECGRESVYAEVHCYWSHHHKCTSDFAETGEDKVCPLVPVRSSCISNSYTLERPCVWYEPLGPTESPSMDPTMSPTDAPTMEPTQAPSSAPSSAPSPAPSPAPTSMPTRSPTRQPTPRPTPRPTRHPTLAPTPRPTPRPTTRAPTHMPTFSPTKAAPSQSPSASPSDRPTNAPSASPSTSPSLHPTTLPTIATTAVPSQSPSMDESHAPSQAPSDVPSKAPSSSPTGTSISIDHLLQVCQCDQDLVCMNESQLSRGTELQLCGRAQHPVILEQVEQLQLSQYPIQQIVIQEDAVNDGVALFWSFQGEISLFIVRVNVQDDFFVEASENDVIVTSGRVRYSTATSPRKHVRRRSMEESAIFVASNDEFTFRLNIALQPDTPPELTSQPVQNYRGNDGSDDSSDPNEKRRKVQITVPTVLAAVMLALFIPSLVKVILTQRALEEQEEQEEGGIS